MKTLITTLGLAATFALAPVAGHLWAQDNTAPAPAPTQGDGSVSFQTFYDQLANQGTWVQSDQYGYVFQPTENDSNWRPYTYGHWVNTDAGMTWVSDDSFGWATDHYGRWVNLAGTGWVWVPGYTWAPAWVSWRDSDDEVGWAPLPPDSDVGIDYYGSGVDLGFGSFGFHIGDDCDTAYGIGPGCYNFCPVAYIGDRDAWRHFHDRRDNFALIGRTRNVTNINFNRDGAGRFGHVRAEGPSVAALNARSHTRIATANLADVSGRNEAGLHGNTLGVYAPRVDRNTVRTARPGAVSGRIAANAAVNRGTDIRHPLAVNSRVSPAAATPEQVRAATAAQGHFAGNARIATSNTRISRQMTQPLTSMRTETRTAASTTQEARAPREASVSGESRFTGEPAATRAAAAPATRHQSAVNGESSFTGEPARSRAVEPNRTEPAEHHASSYAAGQVYHPATVNHPAASASMFHASEPASHPAQGASVYHPSQPTYHPAASAPVFHSSQPVYHSETRAPVFHSSAPAFHPQASFHSAAPAPQPHFGGGGAHASAPAAHAGGGGGHPSGGGAAHASAHAAGPAGKH